MNIMDFTGGARQYSDRICGWFAIGDRGGDGM